MHCVSEYPTKLDESQLGFIKELKKLNYPIGLSDPMGFESSIASIGIRIIENILLSIITCMVLITKFYECKTFKKFVKTIDDLVKSLHLKQRTISKEEKGNSKVAKKALYYNKVKKI